MGMCIATHTWEWIPSGKCCRSCLKKTPPTSFHLLKLLLKILLATLFLIIELCPEVSFSGKV